MTSIIKVIKGKSRINATEILNKYMEILLFVYVNIKTKKLPIIEEMIYVLLSELKYKEKFDFRIEKRNRKAKIDITKMGNASLISN